MGDIYTPKVHTDDQGYRFTTVMIGDGLYRFSLDHYGEIELPQEGPSL